MSLAGTIGGDELGKILKTLFEIDTEENISDLIEELTKKQRMLNNRMHSDSNGHCQ